MQLLHSGPPVRVLIAEDREDNRISLEQVLKALGHSVVGAAKNGPEMLQLIQQHGADNIDVNIVDGIMQYQGDRYSGITAAKLAWQRHLLPSVILTGDDDQEVIAAVRAGQPEEEADDADAFVIAFLIKPAKGTVLDSALRTYQRESKRTKMREHVRGRTYAAIYKVARLEDNTVQKAEQRVKNFASFDQITPYEAANRILSISAECEARRLEIEKKTSGKKQEEKKE